MAFVSLEAGQRVTMYLSMKNGERYEVGNEEIVEMQEDICSEDENPTRRAIDIKRYGIEGYQYFLSAVNLAHPEETIMLFYSIEDISTIELATSR